MNFSIVLLIQNNWLKAFFSSNKKFLIKKIILIVILLVILASLDYYLMKWYENFYDKAISLKDYEVFKFLIFQFIIYLIVQSLIDNYKNYQINLLIIDYRQFVLYEKINSIFNDQIKINEEFTQKFSDDIKFFCEENLNLIFNFLEKFFLLIIYLKLLIEGDFRIIFLGLGYSLLAYFLTYYFGKNQVLNYNNLLIFEAKIKHLLNSWFEIHLFKNIFNKNNELLVNIQNLWYQLKLNSIKVLRIEMLLKNIDMFFQNFGIILPYIILAPLFFKNVITFGQLGLFSNSFYKLKTTFLFFVEKFNHVSQFWNLYLRINENQIEILNFKTLKLDDSNSIRIYEGKNGTGKTTSFEKLQKIYLNLYRIPTLPNSKFVSKFLKDEIKKLNYQEYFNLFDLNDSIFKNELISSGEFQKLFWILYFLKYQEKILIADEPFSHLDLETIKKISYLLISLKLKAIILVPQNTYPLEIGIKIYEFKKDEFMDEFKLND